MSSDLLGILYRIYMFRLFIEKDFESEGERKKRKEKMLIYIHNKRPRQIFEAGHISLCNSVNTRPGFYNISPDLSKSILNN